MSVSDKETVAGILKQVLRTEREIGDDEPLTKLGMDSINFIDLLVRIEEEFGVAFDDSFLQLGEFDTIGKIIGKLDEAKAN